MSAIETNWTRPEFKAYLLLYAANANHFASTKEKKIILNMVPTKTFRHIQAELKKDNDYQSIQKILYNLEKFSYSKEDIPALVDDIQAIFNADGKHDVVDETLLFGLKRLMK